LDLGCGDGELLKILKQDKNISGYGIDNDIKNIKSKYKL
jgi:2-polyprenyl-3-methyl-5-hydroxy-6-metoxy-1,4-benzoquinol methylase